MSKTTLDGWVRGPRWIDLEGELIAGANICRIDIETERHVFLLRQRVDYTISGDDWRVAAFQRTLEETFAKSTARRNKCKRSAK